MKQVVGKDALNTKIKKFHGVSKIIFLHFKTCLLVDFFIQYY